MNLNASGSEFLIPTDVPTTMGAHTGTQSAVETITATPIAYPRATPVGNYHWSLVALGIFIALVLIGLILFRRRK